MCRTPCKYCRRRGGIVELALRLRLSIASQNVQKTMQRFRYTSENHAKIEMHLRESFEEEEEKEKEEEEEEEEEEEDGEGGVGGGGGQGEGGERAGGGMRKMRQRKGGIL